MNESVGTNAGKFDGYDVEGHAVCLRPAVGKPISALAYAALDNLQPGELDIPSSRITNLDGTVEYNVADYASVTLGVCEIDRMYVDTCFLPDQYAIQWAWAGNGQLQSYDPITGEWTEWGRTIDPATGNVVGGYALAFKNDAVEPIIYFQRSGKLYKADPADPINTFQLIGATLPAAPSSYPCFAFDPSGRLLAGIASGSTVVEIDPTTGAATNIGALIDVRDGANLQAGPGDWYFDPNGDWFLMARDTRGALFGEPCVDTVLWKIDPATLEAVRISNECSPISGTGAEWLAAGIALLSHSNGTLSQYNSGSGEWSAFPNSAPQAINDLSAQWIIPEPIKVFGFVDKDTPLEDQCEDCLFTMVQNEDTFALECQPFTLAIPGTFGKCEADPNPFVSDPFSPVAGETTVRSDQVWVLGCSDAGPTLWRKFYDAAGTVSTEYKYGSLQEATSLKPAGFSCFECGKVLLITSTIAYCDVDLNKTIYLKETSDGSVVWFDETGEIPEPANKTIGECVDNDSLLPVSEQVICLDGDTYIRAIKEQYVEDPATGLPELANYQVLFYNQDGVFFDSGVLLPAAPVTGEPEGWTLGDCVAPQPPCGDFVSLGKMWYMNVPETPGTLVEWWAPANGPQSGTAVGHDNVSNIFTNTGTTLEHVSGPADNSYVSPVFSVQGTNVADFLTGMGGLTTADTTGTDQGKLSGYFFLTKEAQLRDGGDRTGERGGLWIDNCCNGSLELIEERTTDTNTAQSGVFNGTVIPAGIHYAEAVISDLSAYWNLTLEASFDGGQTYGPLLGYQEKPTLTAVPVIKCKDTGLLFNALTDEQLDPALLLCENPCDQVVEASPTTHIIEGCIENAEGEKVSAYTVISDSGVALFEPKPLADLGFVECC